MSHLFFKRAAVLLVVLMASFTIMILSPRGDATSIVAPGSLKSSPDDLLANQLINRVARLRDRAISACSAGVIAHMRQCKGLRDAANDAYNSVMQRVANGDSLVLLARAIDTAESAVYPQLRTIEQNAKTIEDVIQQSAP